MVTSIFDQAAQGIGQAGQTQTQIAQGGQALQSANSYINPYQQQVIGNTVGRMQDQYGQAMNNIGDNAISSGAFGGSRHGVTEAAVTDDYLRNVGETVGGLNQQGFNTAQQFGFQDVGQQMGAAQQLGGTANSMFNMGQTLNQNQAAQGNQQQNLSQMVLDMANQDFSGYMNNPTQSTNNILAALSGSPLQGNSTQSTTPGLFDYLGLGAQVAGGSMGGGK